MVPDVSESETASDAVSEVDSEAAPETAEARRARFNRALLDAAHGKLRELATAGGFAQFIPDTAFHQWGTLLLQEFERVTKSFESRADPPEKP